MPQPKSSRSSSRSAKPAARKPAAKKPAARKPAAKKPAAAASSRKPASASSARKPAAKKPAARKPAASRSTASRTTSRSTSRSTAAKKPAARKPAASRTSTASGRNAAARDNVSQLRDLLSGGVVLTAQRIQERLDDAVERGRMTRKDAEDLAKGLLDEGRKQTQALISDVEQLLGRGRSDLGSAATSARSAATTASKRARTNATQRGDRVLRAADKARRSVGVGPSFPILGFDELKAGQITSRLKDLKPAELRKVRDYERRNANRKSVLGAIEKALA